MNDTSNEHILVFLVVSGYLSSIESLLTIRCVSSSLQHLIEEKLRSAVSVAPLAGLWRHRTLTKLVLSFTILLNCRDRGSYSHSFLLLLRGAPSFSWESFETSTSFGEITFLTCVARGAHWVLSRNGVLLRDGKGLLRKHGCAAQIFETQVIHDYHARIRGYLFDEIPAIPPKGTIPIDPVLLAKCVPCGHTGGSFGSVYPARTSELIEAGGCINCYMNRCTMKVNTLQKPNEPGIWLDPELKAITHFCSCSGIQFTDLDTIEKKNWTCVPH